jgi:hypothetical protein
MKKIFVAVLLIVGILVLLSSDKKNKEKSGPDEHKK